MSRRRHDWGGVHPNLPGAYGAKLDISAERLGGLAGRYIIDKTSRGLVEDIEYHTPSQHSVQSLREFHSGYANP